jgi:hypothetical protein
LQYELFGMNAAAYHVTLLVLHMANTALVWFIARRLFDAGWAANLAALIFALHPAYADAVTWLSGGNRTVAALPLLACVACFIMYRSANRWRLAWYAASVIAFVSAILLHSSALGIAVVLPAYAAFVDGKPRDALRPSFWWPFVPFIVIAGMMTFIQIWVRDHLGTEDQFSFGWHQYRLLGQYLGFAFVPVFTAGIDAFDDPWRTGLEGLQGLASVAALGLAVWLIASRRWWGLGLLTFGWFVVGLLPDTTLDFPLQGRLLYMPGPALALFVAAVAVAAGALLNRDVQPVAGIVAVVVVLLALGPVLLLTLDHRNDTSVGPDEAERFTQQLREAVQSVPEGGTLYVADPPLNLRVFGQSPLEALVEIYYGKRRVLIIERDEAAARESSLDASDRIFVFER